MCGIYGITAKDEAFINKFIDICSHRGPDGRGVWSDNFVTLGHNLLAITEQSTQSQQPWITTRLKKYDPRHDYQPMGNKI